MKKVGIWDQCETHGYYNNENIDKYVYVVPNQASIEEIKKIERYGSGLMSKLYTFYLILKY